MYAMLVTDETSQRLMSPVKEDESNNHDMSVMVLVSAFSTAAQSDESPSSSCLVRAPAVAHNASAVVRVRRVEQHCRSRDVLRVPNRAHLHRETEIQEVTVAKRMTQELESKIMTANCIHMNVQLEDQLLGWLNLLKPRSEQVDLTLRLQTRIVCSGRRL